MSAKIKVGSKTKGGGISIFTIAILLMIGGAVLEHATEYTDLGAVLFTIVFWLFFIPLIIIALVVVGIIIVMVLSP